MISRLKWFVACFNCDYYCMENFVDIGQQKGADYLPKINKTCCPKVYPVSIYLRNLAGVWNK